LRADIERRELVEAALREREEELQVMALTDSLTGLANRRAFMDQLEQAHARATRRGSPVCVLFCDVDHFKAINDTYGHASGDEVLREVAARVRTHFRTEDIVGRLGGDEFAVICENGSTATQVLIDRLHDVLAVPYVVQGELVSVTVSVGMASPEDGETNTQLLERADSTMYLIKATHHLT
jgi:diguanylate cyclase (GGDEF)-like protein